MRRRLPFLLTFIALTILLHVYIGLRLLPDAALAPPWTAVGAVLLAALYGAMLLGVLGRLVKRQPLADRLSWVGMLALGLFSSLLVLTFLRDVLLLVLHLAQALSAAAWLSPRWLARSALAVPVLALALTLLGFFNARRRARVVTVSVPIAALPPELDGFTIAQISDLHVGPTIKRRYIDAIVDAVNALSPDLIAVTGDVVDGSVSELNSHTAPLARLSARHGAFLVTGNHEYYSGANEWIAEFRRLGLNVLLNEHVVLDHDSARMVVAGITDFTAPGFDASHHSDPQRALAGAPLDIVFKLLLAHQPRSAPAAALAGFSLQLSGHTHGGQFLPWNLFVRLQQPFTAGLDKLGDLWVYTSRGTGYWGPPKRLGAPSEITWLKLRAQP
jgi:predicted MPP superfamily phosphohydrolase